MADLLLAVASYTEPVGHAPAAHGAGISVLNLDIASRTATTRFTYDEIRNPSFLCAHPSRPILYVLSEVYDGPGTISSVELTEAGDRLVRRSQLDSGGPVPSYVSLYDDTTLLISHYADETLMDRYGNGSLVSFALDSFGHVERKSSCVALTGSGPHPRRQRGAHGHCILRHPLNGLVYATDLGSDTLVELRVHDGVLTRIGHKGIRPGSGPRHLAFTPDGRHLLAVHELSCEAEVLPVDARGGLDDGVRFSVAPPWSTGSGTAADIAMCADGRRAFVTTRYDDSIVILDARGGWHPAAWARTGRLPRSLTLTPDERHLVVANQDSDALEVYAIDGNSLTPVMAIPVATPSLVRVLAPREIRAAS